QKANTYERSNDGTHSARSNARQAAIRIGPRARTWAVNTSPYHCRSTTRIGSTNSNWQTSSIRSLVTSAPPRRISAGELLSVRVRHLAPLNPIQELLPSPLPDVMGPF